MSSRATAGWVIVLTGVGSLMAALDTLVVSTALSTIRVDMGASVEQLTLTHGRYEPTSASSTATGGSSHRSAMPSWNRANASTDWSGFAPAASTDARWTKLTPSSSRNVAYRSPGGAVR